MRHLRYFTWNVFITGTLVAGYLMHETGLAGKIIGVVYVGLFALLLLSLSSVFIDGGKELAKAINKAGFSWHIITDTFFMLAAGYMGYKKIAVCMFVELAACLYLAIWARVKKAEDNK